MSIHPASARVETLLAAGDDGERQNAARLNRQRPPPGSPGGSAGLYHGQHGRGRNETARGVYRVSKKKDKSRKKDRQQDEQLLKLKELIKEHVAELGLPASANQIPPIGTARQEDPPPLVGPLRAMVIMAHPDDAEFLCAGTVAKWCAEGWDVHYVLVTGGDKGTHDPGMHPEKLAAIREEEQRAACRVLGVKECHFLGYPDGFTVDEHELRGQIVRLLRLCRPDVVVTWDAFRGSFNHRDHRNVGTVVADAVYPLVRDRLFYGRDEEDGLESHAVNEILLAGAADPDYTVDITEHWERKIDAILCHASQIGGRTKEDFLKMRADQVKKDGEKPIEEKFRRWSIRRAAAPVTEEKKDGEEDGETDETGAPVLAGTQKGQRG